MKPKNLPIYITESELRKIISNKISEVLDNSTKHFLEINHLINEEFNLVLNEENGVRFETECAADDVIEKIKNIYKTTSKIQYDFNNLKNYSGILSYTFKEKNITINYRIINFVNSETFIRFQSNYLLSAEYNKEKETIFINIALVNGNFLLETANNSIQHELSHIFDRIKNNDIIIPEKNEKLYKMAVSQCENPVNELSYDLAMAVYISFKTEQIAMCNGLDAMLRKNNDSLFDIRQTNEYHFLYYLKKVITNINDYKTLIIRLYKMTPEKMLKRLTTAYYDYLRRIGRIVIHNKK